MYDFARTQSHDDLGARRICHFCVQDCILATGVLQQGTCALCFYCTVVRESLPLQHLAERVHEILQEHFNVTRHEPSDLESAMIRHGLIDFWERPGESVDAIIAEIADVDDAIANDVGTLLCQRYDQDGSDPLYGRDVRYLEREADATCFRNAWADLARSKEVLNTILSGLSTDRAFPQDTKVIREIGPNDEDRFVWRARVAQSHAEIEAIMKAPVRELGPPPAQNAPPGRMNERGCPVLYGAFDEHTCVAEVRAPVGSHVAVAKFELLRPVLLLDLDALADVYVVGVSHFDPDYSMLQARAEFLRSLVRDISRPVMPAPRRLPAKTNNRSTPLLRRWPTTLRMSSIPASVNTWVSTELSTARRRPVARVAIWCCLTMPVQSSHTLIRTESIPNATYAPPPVSLPATNTRGSPYTRENRRRPMRQKSPPTSLL